MEVQKTKKKKKDCEQNVNVVRIDCALLFLSRMYSRFVIFVSTFERCSILKG